MIKVIKHGYARYQTQCNIGKEMFNKVRKETAKEILQQIHNLCKERDSIQFDDIYYLVNKYGVEVE